MLKNESVRLKLVKALVVHYHIENKNKYRKYCYIICSNRTFVKTCSLFSSAFLLDYIIE